MPTLPVNPAPMQTGSAKALTRVPPWYETAHPDREVDSGRLVLERRITLFYKLFQSRWVEQQRRSSDIRLEDICSLLTQYPNDLYIDTN